MNEKLKGELLTVISSMEVQLQRVQERRRERLRADAEANLDMKIKNQKGQRKFKALKKEVEYMQTQLDNAFDIDRITRLEDNVKEKKQLLLVAYEETQAQAKVKRH